jgi:hypothetical protein
MVLKRPSEIPPSKAKKQTFNGFKPPYLNLVMGRKACKTGFSGSMHGLEQQGNCAPISLLRKANQPEQQVFSLRMLSLRIRSAEQRGV